MSRTFFSSGKQPLLAVMMLAASASPAETPRITVLRTGRNALVRCAFNERKDLVLDVKDANEDAYFIAKNTPLENYKSGQFIHQGVDDFSAIQLADFGYLSGNHGSYFGHKLTVAEHGLSEKDIGSTVVHGSGTKMCLVDVPDKNSVLLHPYGSPGAWAGFKVHLDGVFFLGARELKPEKIERCQIWPMNRFRAFRWKTPGGRIIPEGVEVKAEYVDLEIEHDVVDPRAMMEYLKSNPGKRFSPALSIRRRMTVLGETGSAADMAGFASLPSLLSVKTRQRYQPYCARTIHRTTTFNAPVANVSALDVIYGWGYVERADTFFYIPRVKKTTLKGAGSAPGITLDLSAGEVMPKVPWKLHDYIRKADCTDPEDMPDRFIRIGIPEKRRFGVAIGYSPLYGISAKSNRSAEREIAYFFYPTGKMYPNIFNLKNVQAGRRIEHCGYTQFFDPDREPDATAFYHHRDGDSHLVYLDFHKTLKRKNISLPKELCGKKISIIEKTPSVALHTGDTVPENGLSLDVAGGHGSLVLRLTD